MTSGSVADTAETRMTSNQTEIDETPRSDQSGNALVRNLSRALGALLILLTAVGWIQNIPNGGMWLPSFFIGAFGIWLVVTAKGPHGPRTIPLLVFATGLAGVLTFMAWARMRDSILPDDVMIVQQGDYEDICPGRTIPELLGHGHEEIQWTSYLNKYGYRSVRANCLDASGSPRVVMIWTIDENDRYWIQYAALDNVAQEPYVLLAQLCRRMSDDADPPG
ncbi:MAG: hypothetical protein CMJ34_11360 [Phycisphaerae bacterium]|nr:hypothetical protein [Phycisphaerae bacterium]